jgi:anti-sigma factor RsiW
MHPEVIESLEDYLAGLLEPAAQRRIEAHLSACGMCRQEVSAMRDISEAFSSLHTEEAVEPAPGFYARVMQRVGDRQPVPSFTSFFALDFAFGRRLVFASLLTLTVLGSYLVSHEERYSAAPSPATIMAQQISPAFDAADAQDRMLVTLASYEY